MQGRVWRRSVPVPAPAASNNFCCPGTTRLSLAPKPYFWPVRPRLGLAVPQFQALHDAVAIHGNRAASAASADHVAHFQYLRLAIAVMDHDVVELNGRVDHAKLQETIPAGRGAYPDVV